MEIYLLETEYRDHGYHGDLHILAKRGAGAANHSVRAWEDLMWKYQRALPQARPGEKWVLIEQILTFAED